MHRNTKDAQKVIKEMAETCEDEFCPSPEALQKRERKNLPEAEQLIKKAKQIKQFSEKRKKQEQELIAVKQKMLEDWDGCCDGCGTGQGYIDFSHRLPRSQFPHLIAEKENLDLYCRVCHANIEAGMYDLLKNGKEVAKYIQSQSLVYYNEKVILGGSKKAG